MRVIYCCFPLYGHLDWGGVIETLERIKDLGHDVSIASGRSIRQAVAGLGFDFIDLDLPSFKVPHTGQDIEKVLLDHIKENFCEPKSNLRAVEILKKFHATQKIDLIYCEPFFLAPLVFSHIMAVPLASVWLEKRQMPDWYKECWNKHHKNLRRAFSGRYGVALPGTRQVSSSLAIGYTIERVIESELSGRVEFVGCDPLPCIDKKNSRPAVYFSAGTLFWNNELLNVMKGVAALMPDVNFVFSRGYGVWEQNIQALPNVRVVEYLDESRELCNFDVVVSQAGQGTITKCIRAGLPVLAMPAFFGNMQVSKWLERLGMGYTVLLPAEGEFVRSLLHVLLTDRQKRQNALQARKEFADAGGSKRAVNLIIDLARNN